LVDCFFGFASGAFAGAEAVALPPLSVAPEGFSALAAGAAGASFFAPSL
jgi:hypothetical protein